MEQRMDFEKRIEDKVEFPDRKLMEFTARQAYDLVQSYDKVEKHLSEINGNLQRQAQEINQNKNAISSNTTAIALVQTTQSMCPINLFKRRWFQVLVFVLILLITGVSIFDVQSIIAKVIG